MADDSLAITVSYSGRERRIPLSVRPSLELSDSEVDQAELELCGIVRHLFNIPVEAAFSLHEAESSRTLTKESFRDPGYIQAFPSHWYLTVEKTGPETEAGEEEEEGNKQYESSSAFDLYAEGLSDMDEALPSLAELSSADVKYQSVKIRAEASGLFGVKLRYFSIQPVSPAMRPDSPSDFGSQNSQHSSTSLDILSTTFVHHLEGAGQEAGLQRGDTVHMINGESIIRSSFSEIQDLLAQCGSVISLMVLPKEHDDLQFLYPQYTEGCVGEFTSGDERVITRDIPIVVGSGSSLPEDAGSESEGQQQLSLYSFRGSGSSLDNTQSNSSSEHLQQQDDRLISCSIHDIVTQTPSRSSITWTSRSGATGSNSHLDRLDENTTYDPPSWRPVANGDTRYDSETVEVDPSWYQDPGEDGLETASQPVQDPFQKERVFRAHSQDSGVVHRVGLLSSGEDTSGSQPMWAEDLGVVRIGRHSKKSLEMLTSLSTAAPGPPARGMRRIQSDDVIGQMARSSPTDGLRRHSEQQHTDMNVTPTAKAPPTSFQSEDSLPALPPARERPRKSTRSYSSQRKQLHQSRSRIADSDAPAKTAEILVRNLSQPVGGGELATREEGARGRHEERFYSESGTAHSISPLQDEEEYEEQSPDLKAVTPTIKVATEEPVVRGGERDGGRHTLRHGQASPPMSPRRFQSATLDPRTVHPGHTHPGHTHMGNYRDQMIPLLLGPTSRRVPIYKSTSAQTPYGTEVVRERNIDEAVAASQGGSVSLSVQQPVSGGGVEGEGGGDVATRVGLFSPPYMGRRHSHYEERPSKSVTQCAGMLNKKQVSEGQGRKSGARSWKPFYSVLVGSHMVFYKDKKDADANKPCEEPPLEVVPGRADLTHSYTKRRNVFRIICGQGAEYLLQCETSESMLHWVTTITRLNGGVKMIEQPAPKITHLLTPNSPLSSRRGSSPLPVGHTHRGTGRKKGLGLKSLKSLYRNKKGVGGQPSFGQQLSECPMSSENRNVPLVVEMCVREVEEHGLDVEGLYRKPGQRSVIGNMVGDIDKGQFDCEDYGDIHTIGSLLKKFFQDLQDPLIPSDRYKEFLAVVREGQSEGEQVTRLRGLVFHLPTANYHTLRYLTSHLNKVAEHSEENKMVLRNVAMVFGPTLMLPSGSEDFDLGAMNCTFTVVELICKHWQNIFDTDKCYEEVAQERARERDRLKAEAQAEAEGLGPGQRVSSDPAVNSLKVKKDNALFNASPKMVRRIKNQFSGSRRAADRNSYSGGESIFSASLPAARKQHNRSETLPSPNPMPPAFLSPSQPVPASKWGRAGSSGTLQSARPRDPGLPGYGGDLNPHTRYGGGREEKHVSLWKDPQRGRGSSDRREGQSRSQLLSSHPPPPPIAHQRELLTSYQQPHTLPYHRHTHSSPAHESLHRSTTLPASPEHRGSLPVSPPGHRDHPPRAMASSPVTRRKISYNLAVTEGYSYQNTHNRRYMDQRGHQDNLREDFYAPPSSRSSNHSSKSGPHVGYQPGGRGQHHHHQMYGPPRAHPKSHH